MAKTKIPKLAQRRADEVGMAFAYLDQSPMIPTAERLLRQFKGQWYAVPSGAERYVVNTIFSLVNLILPNLIFQPPMIRVRPKQPTFLRAQFDGGYQSVDNIRAASIMESVINHVMHEIGAWTQLQQAIQDALFWGHGVVKSGFAVKTTAQDGSDQQQIDEERPFVSRISPRDFAWHPLGTDVDNSPLCIHRVIRHRADLKDHPRFSRLTNVTSTLPKFLQEKMTGTPTSSAKSMADDYVTIHEVHDQKNNRIWFYAGDPLIYQSDIANPYDFAGSHFDIIRFARDPDEFFGIPLLAMIEDEAVAINQLVTTMMCHIRKFPGIVDVEAGSMDQDDIQRLITQEQGSVHQVTNLNGVRRIAPLSMGSEYFNLLQVMFSIVDRVLGIPDFQRAGQRGSSRKTATEVTFEQGDSSIRREYYLQQVKAFVLSSVRKVAVIIQREFDERRIVPITGNMAESRFLEFSKEDLQGEYQFDFDIDSLRVINEVSVNQFVNLLNILATHPPLQPMLKTLDPVKTTKKILKRMQINLEEVQNTQFRAQVYMLPDVENRFFLEGRDVPDPKMDEDHAAHLTLHASVQQLPDAQRHMRIHLAMQQTIAPPMQMGAPGVGPVSAPAGAAPTPGTPPDATASQLTATAASQGVPSAPLEPPAAEGA